jgi:hypothetical protein
MLVKQTIEYQSDNKYFAGFIQNIINESKIDANVSMNDGNIELLLSTEDEQKLETFNTMVAKYLPHSMFLGDIKTSNMEGKIEASQFKSDAYKIGPCNKCLELLSNPSSSSYLDANLKCTHYSNDNVSESISFSIYSPHYSKGCSVLITDPTTVYDLFIVTDDELKTLYSIEKPTIKATIKDETLKELTGKSYIYIKAPFDNRSFLASLNAKESGVNYLFFEDNDDLKVVIVQKNTSIIKANRVANELKELHEDATTNRFLNIANEAKYEKGVIGANLSSSGINFLVANEVGVKKVINFQDFNLSNLLKNFSNTESRTKLLENFKMKFPEIYEQLETNDYKVYETICVLLELDELGFEALSNKSYEFRGNGGLTIDTHFSSDGFDFESFIGSIISFKLAGVDMHYLAYSIFESLADMTILVLNQLKKEFNIDKFIMMGDMFSNSVLYSRVLSKFQLSNPYFSKAIALS